MSPQQLDESLAVTEAQDYDNALCEPVLDLNKNAVMKATPRGPMTAVLKAARGRGHAVSEDVMQTARPYFLLLSAPNQNAVQQKHLEAEARATAQALAHWRSGRQVLLQLVMDEPGVLEFAKDGCSYVTSSPAGVRDELPCRAPGGRDEVH